MQIFENINHDDLLDQLCETNLNPVFILACDRDATIYKASHKTEALLSRLKSDFIGMPFLRYFPPEFEKGIRAVLRRSRRAGLSQRLEIEKPRPDEDDMIVDIIATHIKVAHYEFYFVQCNDCTQRVLQEKNLEQMHSDLQELSKRDELTGLLTKIYFRNLINNLCDDQLGLLLTLIIIDVDHFKEYNDRHGHEEGNQILKQISELILDECDDSSDILARVGGEEFGIVRAGILAEEAVKLSERIRRRISETSYRGGSEQPLGHLTVSCGIATLDEGNGDDLIASATEAMMRAKSEGRNRTVFIGPPE